MAARLTSGRASPVTSQVKTRMTRARSMTTCRFVTSLLPGFSERCCGRLQVEGSVSDERVLIEGYCGRVKVAQ
jgi:hypothetical protein